MSARVPAAPDRRYSLLLAVVVALTFVMMTVPADLNYAAKTPNDEANPVTRTLWLALLAISLTVAFSRMALTRQVLRRFNRFYLLFVALAFASVLWSIDSGLTLRRLLRLLTQCSVFLAFAVAAWQPPRFQSVVRPVLTTLLVASLIFGLASPELAIHQEDQPELKNAWHGITTQKNVLGSIASFAFLMWLHALLARQSRLPWIVLGGGAAAACLILSHSSTSIMATFFASCLMMMMMRSPGSLRRSMPFLVTTLSVLILLYALAMLQVVPGLGILLQPIPALTGKDLSFSGRWQIWSAVEDHIRVRPFLGSGYGAFWAGPLPTSESYYIKGALLGFYPGSSHNGYLEILNDLGSVGMTVLAGYLFAYLAQALRLYRIDRRQGALFVALFLMQAVANLSESLWLNTSAVDFIVMSLATASLARSLLEAQARPAAAAPTVLPPMRRSEAQSPRTLAARRFLGATPPRR